MNQPERSLDEIVLASITNMADRAAAIAAQNAALKKDSKQ